MVSLHGDVAVGARARTLDSSEVLRGGNYRMGIREIALTRSQANFDTLSEALVYTQSEGYYPKQMDIVNISHGEPEKNEPRPVLTLIHKLSGGKAIIAEDTYGTGGSRIYCFYVQGNGFNYIE